MPRSSAYLAYGILAYLVFGAALVWAFLFIGGLGPLPTVDQGRPSWPVLIAVAVNLVLLGLFAVQHTVMARPAFKRLESRLLPAGAERSTFVLAASLRERERAREGRHHGRPGGPCRRSSGTFATRWLRACSGASTGSAGCSWSPRPS